MVTATRRAVSRPRQTSDSSVGTKNAQLGRILHDADAMLSKLNILQGQKISIEEGLNELRDSVGRAKGRLLIKPDADAFLEELQADLHKKSVGTYETLLTALANDVLGSGDKIGLELYTERGLSALDIFIDADGNRVDIFDGAGGSMTNVISLGLRMIATVRSGMRRFVALDEPDCWIKPTNVGHFYQVLDDLGSRLNMQTIMISHHSEDLMPEGFALAKLRKERGQVVCENDPRAGNWTADQKGIRQIQMRNFMSHADTTIRLAPGATAIVGDNHIGKSVVVRALRAIAYGEVSDADIRHGEREVNVRLEIEDGKFVCLSRCKGRNPVNQWTLEDAEGAILRDHETGMEFCTGGRSVPAWATSFLEIDRFEGIEHQLSHQKLPTFLLSEPASKRAAVLSIGRESNAVRSMIARQKELAKEDTKLVRDGEKQAGVYTEKLKTLERIAPLSEQITATKEAIVERMSEQSQEADIAKWLSEYEVVTDKVKKLRPQVTALDKLTDNIPDISESQKVKHGISSLGTELRKVQDGIKAAKSRIEALSDLPEVAPEVTDTKAMQSLITSLDQQTQKISSARKVAKDTEEKMNKADAELSAFFKENGGVCPLCNGQIKDAKDVVNH